MNTATPTPLRLHDQMLDDHVELARLCEKVIDTFEAGDREGCDAAFRQLERQLEGHLTFEDRELLPALAHVDPTEAATLAAEHRAIRGRLLEMGVGVDLHLTRCTAVKALIADLGLHARREGALLYRWAADNAIAAPTSELLSRLREL